MIKYNYEDGTDIFEAIQRAKELAIQSNDVVWANINGIVLIVSRNSDIHKLHTIYEEQKLWDLKQKKR